MSKKKKTKEYLVRRYCIDETEHIESDIVEAADPQQAFIKFKELYLNVEEAYSNNFFTVSELKVVTEIQHVVPKPIGNWVFKNV